MNNLTQQMQERLDKWRVNPQPVGSVSKIRGNPISRRNGKNDYGDVISQEEWDQEIKKSQNRR